MPVLQRNVLVPVFFVANSELRLPVLPCHLKLELEIFVQKQDGSVSASTVLLHDNVFTTLEERAASEYTS